MEAGRWRMKVALDEIAGVAAAPQPSPRGAVGAGLAPPASNVTVRSQSSGTVAPDEINVIGMTVEEATDRLDKFLDAAPLANKPRIRVNHGHRTGALPQGIGGILASHPF